MRVKVEGLVDFERVGQILEDVYRRSPLGSSLSGVNLYLTIRDAQGRRVEFLNPQGEPIDVLVYSEERVHVPVRTHAGKPVAAPQEPRVVPFKRRATGSRDSRPSSEPEPPIAA